MPRMPRRRWAMTAHSSPRPRAICATGARASPAPIGRVDGRRQTFRIVGEDEADPSKGSISYVSPLAALLVGKSVGDTIKLAGGEAEIVAIWGASGLGEVAPR